MAFRRRMESDCYLTSRLFYYLTLSIDLFRESVAIHESLAFHTTINAPSIAWAGRKGEDLTNFSGRIWCRVIRF
jgi:hypothetical protein